jgi:hypothetical protein
MSPNTWGPPVWTLFHTLAEKITETGFQYIGIQLFSYIFRISSYLPCPECSSHASRFLGKVNQNRIKTKYDLKNILYVFHNVVNGRKGKPIYHTDNLNVYQKKNLNNVYKNFIQVYNTRGNMKLLAESFQRQRILSEFKTWLVSNSKFFVTIPLPILNTSLVKQNTYNEDKSIDKNTFISESNEEIKIESSKKYEDEENIESNPETIDTNV